LLEKEILQIFKETNGKLDPSFSTKMEVKKGVPSLPGKGNICRRGGGPIIRYL
jgi:hypothetical protein